MPAHIPIVGDAKRILARLAGEYRAPKSRDHLRAFHHFCLDHVRDYNRAWDFFSGMSQSEIEEYLREDVTWHRPTGPLGNGMPKNGSAWRLPLDDLAFNAMTLVIANKTDYQGRQPGLSL